MFQFVTLNFQVAFRQFRFRLSVTLRDFIDQPAEGYHSRPAYMDYERKPRTSVDFSRGMKPT